MKREFRALAGISHPNLVELYELFVTNRDCFFTMELVDGVSFVDYVRGGARAGVEYAQGFFLSVPRAPQDIV